MVCGHIKEKRTAQSQFVSEFRKEGVEKKRKTWNMRRGRMNQKEAAYQGAQNLELFTK